MLWLAAVPAAAQTMIIGIDEKVTWDAKGKQLFTPPGKDAVSVVDISNPEAPKIIANLPLMNSIFGPPVNLAVSPDGKLAVVANSMDWQKDGDAWKPVPDNKLVVFSPDGQYIYVGNYMDRDVSILKVEKNGRVVNTGKSLKLPGQPASMRGAK